MAPQGRTDRAPTPAPALRAGAPSTAPLPPLLWPRPYTRPFRLGAAVTQVSDGQDGLGRFSDPFFLMIRSQKEMHVRGQVRVHRSRVPAPGTEARPPSERGLPTRALALSRKRTERDAADQLLTANPGGSGQPLGTPADGSRRFSSPTRLLRDRNITLLMRLWNFFFHCICVSFYSSEV